MCFGDNRTAIQYLAALSRPEPPTFVNRIRLMPHQAFPGVLVLPCQGSPGSRPRRSGNGGWNRQVSVCWKTLDIPAKHSELHGRRASRSCHSLRPPALSAQTQFITTRQQRLQVNRSIGALHLLPRSTTSAGCAAPPRVHNAHNPAGIEPLRSTPSRPSPRSYADRVLRGPVTHHQTICTTLLHATATTKKSHMVPFRHDSLFGF